VKLQQKGRNDVASESQTEHGSTEIGLREVAQRIVADKAKGTAILSRAYDTGEESSLEQYTNEVEDILLRAVEELGLSEVQADPEDGASGLGCELRPVLPQAGGEVHDVDDAYVLKGPGRRARFASWRRSRA
jgi:hypothetical protein